LNVLSRAPKVINAYVCLSPSELQSFLLKIVRQTHTPVTSLLTLSDFKLSLCEKTLRFQNQDLRTLKLHHSSMESSSSSQGVSMQIDYGESYIFRPKTMKTDEENLVVQVETPVDLISLKHHGVDVSSYLLHQGLNYYFGMLNGPTYEALVKHFWVRASIYDLGA